jgi:hypothetical protein
MCNYAKKAGKDKKGICHSPLNIEVTGSVKDKDWAKISITFVIIFWLVVVFSVYSHCLRDLRQVSGFLCVLPLPQRLMAGQWFSL